MLNSSCAKRCVYSSLASAPLMYFSTSALLTRRRFTAACLGMPESSEANAKIVSTDLKSFFVSASVMRTSSVASLCSLRARSPRLCEEPLSWQRVSAGSNPRKKIRKKRSEFRQQIIWPHSGTKNARFQILSEWDGRLTAKLARRLTKVMNSETKQHETCGLGWRSLLQFG